MIWYSLKFMYDLLGTARDMFDQLDPYIPEI